MRFETIRNPVKRRQWEEFIETAHWKLREQKLDLKFRTVKPDGSYAKASTVLPAVYFAFAQDFARKWVELEIKPRTINGERKPQLELYSFLKENLRGRKLSLSHRLTWGDEDSTSSPKENSCDDLKIKVYLNDLDENQWIEAMVRLVYHFLPFLTRFESRFH